MSFNRREFLQTLALLGASFVVPVGRQLTAAVPVAPTFPDQLLLGFPIVQFQPEGSNEWKTLGLVQSSVLERAFSNSGMPRVENFRMEIASNQDFELPDGPCAWAVRLRAETGVDIEWAGFQAELEDGDELVLTAKPDDTPFGTITAPAIGAAMHV